MHKESSFFATNHMYIIHHYYFLGWGLDVPSYKDKGNVLIGWKWAYLNDEQFGRMKGHSFDVSPQSESLSSGASDESLQVIPR